MADFALTEQHLAVTCQRYPDFPRRPATLARLVKHIYKQLQDRMNLTLKPYGINYPEYNLLMMLYGSANGMMSPSALADAAGEKSANITRLTNELCELGLIDRSGSSDDRRKIELSLTRKGQALLERLLPDVCGFLARQGRHLAVSEQVQLETLLKKLLRGMAD